MNKQIEEMTKIMNETCNIYDEQGNHVRNKCGECDCWSDDNHCCCSYNSKEAEALYNAGYRKVSVGNWVDVYNGKYANQLYKCSVCGAPAYGDGKIWFLTKFCPSCGADMKGEVQ